MILVVPFVDFVEGEQRRQDHKVVHRVVYKRHKKVHA